MNHFDYRDGVLHAEDVPIPDIAAAVGTPFYCYSTATLTRHYNVFAKAFAGSRRAGLLRHEGEFQPGGAASRWQSSAPAPTWCRKAKCAARWPPAFRRSKILFSGVGKTAREMDFALDAGILCFNVESEPELELLSARAVATGRTAPVSLRINPDVDAKTHKKISTGKAENKFGIPWQRAREVYARAAEAARHPASPASTRISAARSPICSPSTTPLRCSPNWSARCGPTATRSSMSISAAASAFPTAPTTIRRRCPTPMRRSSGSMSPSSG